MADVFLGLPTGRRYETEEAEPGQGEPVLTVRDVGAPVTPPRDQLGAIRLPPGQAVDRYRVQEGDVVLTCRGTQLKVARVAAEGSGALATSNLIVVRPRREPVLLPAVLHSLLQSEAVQAQLRNRSRSSAGTVALTPRDVESLRVPVPPIAIQETLARLSEVSERHYRLAQEAAELSRRLAAQVAANWLFGEEEVR